ncbi:glycosyltransferase [Candidatus Pelagibacter sp.]|jgi:glycosyltransferase involved in cell wall biosynthesis|nr:glycosyltransferase [Candidatus Pelagibacter sp.]
MKISILLPYKENFSPKYAGAVSLFVSQTVESSKFKKDITIYGNTNYTKILSKNYINLDLKKSVLQSSSKIYVDQFIKSENDNKSDIIEVHNRPNYIKQIKNESSAKVSLYFHNDPLNMNGSTTIKERNYLLNNLDAIIFNSEWSKKRFFIGLKKSKTEINLKTHIIHQSSSRVKINFKKKAKIISFVGKLNTAKGYDLFGDAVIKILDKHKNWKAVVFGDEHREKLNFSHKNMKIFGFKEHSFILKYLERVSVSIICSRWNEPFGRTSLEAASRGSAIIISDRGGLPETTNYAIKLKKLNSNEIFKQVEFLINNKSKRLTLQKKIYKDFKYTHEFITSKIDNIRKIFNEDLIRFNPLKSNNPLRILHVTNFNEKHNGRLQYNTSRRINNGFIRLGHNVMQISDRDIVSNAKNLIDPKGINTLNKKIIESYFNFKPDLIVLGHADSVFKSTLDYLKNYNKDLKICQWFLDPVSVDGPDFDKNRKRILDKANFMDANFLTTDPKSISFKLVNSFFMPNPSDSSFEILDNYKFDCKYDVFFAMSHGVHRGGLKSGKIDNREIFIKKLTSMNGNVDFDIYGMNNVQPIWGTDFINKISQSKMGLNLSRGKPLKYYSSDRIVQLMGNGLLTFIDERTKYSDFFNNKEIVNYRNESDLFEKINKYKRDDKQRKIIAKNGKNKYMNYFNSSIIAQFIIDKTFGFKSTKKYLWQ